MVIVNCVLGGTQDEGILGPSNPESDSKYAAALT